MREADEEAGIEPDNVRVVGVLPGARLGTWSYTYVLAWADENVVATPRTTESVEVRWFGLDDASGVPLHESLAADWERLAEAVRAGADSACPQQ